MTTNQLSSKKSNQNKGVVIPGSEFDPSTVTFSKPNMDENLGSKFIYPRANIDGKEINLVLKSDSFMRMPFDPRVETDDLGRTRESIQLEFDTDSQLFENMKAFDEHVIDYARQHHLDWFGQRKKPHRDVVTEKFSKQVKYSKNSLDDDGVPLEGCYPPNWRIKLPRDRNGQFTFIAHNENMEIIPSESVMDFLTRGCYIRPILECSYVWVGASLFSVIWKMVRCIIRPRSTLRDIASIPLEDFDIDNVTYGEPALLESGARRVYVNYDDGETEQRVMLDSPVMYSPFGGSINEYDNNKKFSLDISLGSRDEDAEITMFLDILNSLDKSVHDTAISQSKKWMGKKHKAVVIEDFQRPMVRYSKASLDEDGQPNGKYPPTLRLKMPCYNDKFNFPVMNMAGEPIELTPDNFQEVLPKGVRVRAKVNLSQIFLGKSLISVSWNVVELYVEARRQMLNYSFADDSDDEDGVVENTQVQMADSSDEDGNDADSDADADADADDDDNLTMDVAADESEPEPEPTPPPSKPTRKKRVVRARKKKSKN